MNTRRDLGASATGNDPDGGGDQQPPSDGPVVRPWSGPRGRRLLLLLVLVAGAYLLLPRLASVVDTLTLMRNVSVPYVALALACQTVSVVAQGYVVQHILMALGPGVGIGRTVRVILASSFANMFAPSAGVSGLAIRTRYLSEDGYSLGPILIGFALESLGLGTALSITVGTALLWQRWEGQATPWWGWIVLAGIVALGAGGVSLLLREPRLGDWRYRLLDRANALRRRWSGRAASTQELAGRLSQMRVALRGLTVGERLRWLLGSMARALGEALGLWMMLLAFGQRVTVPVAVISHGLAGFLGFLSSLPSGVLVTEGAMSAILAERGVPLSGAVAATLGFRLIALWLPCFIGLGTWHSLQRQSRRALW